MANLDLAFSTASPASKSAKRAMDVMIASFLLVAAAPLLALIAVWIKIDSPGPVLYRQWRVGFGGCLFQILKFRSMRAGGEGELEAYFRDHPETRTDWEQFQKLWADPRLTRLGWFLRRFSLDELPQLWNVLRGEMSLVGPRPILPSQREIYGRYLSLYVGVKPGMTGMWQVNGRNLTSFSERVEWDVTYIRNWRLSLDVRILMRTAGAVIRGEGAY